MLVPLPSNEVEVKTPGDPQSCADVNSFVLEQAQELQESLSPDYPSFLKLLCPSHLSVKFNLGLPKKFSYEHLPSRDDTIILVDENEQEFTAKFSVHKSRLSGGWRGFSISHNLQAGDILVFQLIEPRKFKVYIVRSKRFKENDEANGCQTPDFQNSKSVDIVNEEGAEEEIVSNGKRSRQRCLISPAEDSPQELKKARLIYESKSAANPSSSDTNNDGLDVLKGIKYPESVVNFKDVKGLEDFSIQVGDIIIDSEMPADLRTKYYELCCSQSMFLHENLIEGLNTKLATEVILETINIADAIRAVESTSSLRHLESWDKTLKAFEDLGMAVGFLRARVDELLTVCRESKFIIDSKKSEKAAAKDELRCLKEKVSNAKAWIKSLNAEIHGLTTRSEEVDFAVKEMASALW